MRHRLYPTDKLTAGFNCWPASSCHWPRPHLLFEAAMMVVFMIRVLSHGSLPSHWGLLYLTSHSSWAAHSVYPGRMFQCHCHVCKCSLTPHRKFIHSMNKTNLLLITHNFGLKLGQLSLWTLITQDVSSSSLVDFGLLRLTIIITPQLLKRLRCYSERCCLCAVCMNVHN